MLFSLSLLRHVFFARGVDDDARTAAPAARAESIARRHVDSVWRTARDLGVPSRDLEDVVQEVLLVVVRRLGDIEANRERAFVVAATARVVANWRRRRRRRPEDLTEAMDSLDEEPCFGGASRRTPEQCLERSQKLALLRRALAEMPEPQRVAFILFELEQLSAREIAEQLGVAESAVFSRVRRAWRVFRRCLERHGREAAEPASVAGGQHG